MLPPVQNFKPKALRRPSVRRRTVSVAIKAGVRGQRLALKAPLRIGTAAGALVSHGSARC